MTSLPVWVQANAAHSLKLVISGELCWYELCEVLKTERQGSSESWFQTADRTMVMIYCQITSHGGDTWLNPTFSVFQPTQNLINSCSPCELKQLFHKIQAWLLKHLSEESWTCSHSFVLITNSLIPLIQMNHKWSNQLLLCFTNYLLRVKVCGTNPVNVAHLNILLLKGTSNKYLCR